jgi:monoamine oxidase
MDRIAKAFEAKVGRMISYSTIVEKIEQNDKGVRVSYVDGSGKKGTVSADYCFCTIPLSVLKGIDMQVSPKFKEAMSGVAYTAVGKIGLQMKRRFWEENHHIYGGIVQTDNPELGSIAMPSWNWQGQKGVLLGYYNFGNMAAKVSAKTLAQRTEFALAGGQKIFPEYRDSFDGASFSASWHRVEHNLGGWAQWTAEGRRDQFPVLLEPDGRIFLAGEHLSHLAGWQAGAIESSWQQIAKLHQRAQAA